MRATVEIVALRGGTEDREEIASAELRHVARSVHRPAGEGEAILRTVQQAPRGIVSRAAARILTGMHASKDPLHGLTLERIVTELAAEFGWAELGRRVPVRCFLFDPSVKSSLTFLRKNPWARTKVEALYVAWKHPRGV